jgi:hypothetical protein
VLALASIDCDELKGDLFLLKDGADTSQVRRGGNSIKFEDHDCGKLVVEVKVV